MSIYCKRCKRELSDDSVYCNYCGKKQITERKAKGRRANGEGTAIKQKNGTYRLYLTEYVNGVRITKTKSGFKTKSDAFRYAPILREQKKEDTVTFQQAFERFISTHQRNHSTIDGYRAAFKYFAPLHNQDIANIALESLQICLDRCDKGRRTKENMRTICGLIYKFMIPRYSRMRPMNLADYLVIYEKRSDTGRESFTPEQLEKIRSLIGKVEYAEYIYCHCYLGFRPSELLNLTRGDYSALERVFTGGAKTDKGTNRKVTVPPKIQPYIDLLVSYAGDGYIFKNQSTGKKMRTEYYGQKFREVMQAAGIDNPVTGGRHKYTPHTCRHTYATMLKRIPGAAEKDVLELIGHTDIQQTIEYQDVSLEDLRKITDLL